MCVCFYHPKESQRVLRNAPHPATGNLIVIDKTDGVAKAYFFDLTASGEPRFFVRVNDKSISLERKENLLMHIGVKSVTFDLFESCIRITEVNAKETNIYYCDTRKIIDNRYLAYRALPV